MSFEFSEQRSTNQNFNNIFTEAKIDKLLASDTIHAAFEDHAKLPNSWVFRSPTGETTLVSIYRESNQDISITNLYAVQNHLRSRHTLDLHLIANQLTGELLLRGELRELGRTPLVEGTQRAEPNPKMIEFLFSENLYSSGAAIALSQTCQSVLETFSDYGVFGVHEYLSRATRTLQGDKGWIQYSPVFESELQELAVDHYKLREQRLSEQFFPNTVWQGYLSNTQASREKAVSSLDESLFILRNICADTLNYMRISSAVDAITEFNDDLDQPYEEESNKTFSLGPRFGIGRFRANFYTDADLKADQVIISLKLPFCFRGNHKNLDRLTIEVIGPEDLLFIRQRYSAKDYDNILAITPYSNNSELFRALFTKLHQVNYANISSQQKIDSLLELLEDYGLKLKPVGMVTNIANCYRGIFGKRKAVDLSTLRDAS